MRASSHQNAKLSIAIKPNLKFHRDYELPHITIQMPVYKEGLKGYVQIIAFSGAGNLLATVSLFRL